MSNRRLEQGRHLALTYELQNTRANLIRFTMVAYRRYDPSTTPRENAQIYNSDCLTVTVSHKLPVRSC